MKHLLLVALLLGSSAWALPNCEEARKNDASKSAALTQLLVELVQVLGDYQQLNKDVDRYKLKAYEDSANELRLKIDEFQARQTELENRKRVLDSLEQCIMR